MKIKLSYLLLASLPTVFTPLAWSACNTSSTISKPDNIYIDHLDGTVSDSETGLMWQKCSLGQTWNPGLNANDGGDDTCDGTASQNSWQAALGKANDDSSYSYSDWRLPNKNELHSLVETACYTPAMNTIFFPSGASVIDKYWSSTPYTGSEDSAWLVSFYYGLDITHIKTVNGHIRLVRDNS